METKEKKLSKKAVFGSYVRWLFYNQSNYSYERYMGTGFLHAMNPVVKELYKDDEEGRKEIMNRHSGFFNCEPCLASPIVGLTVAMEEKKAAGEPLDEEAITSIKTGLMGPASGIGDTLIQGVIVPLLLALCIDFAANGNIAGPVLYCLVITGIVLAISYLGFMMGYKKGSSALMDMLESGVINKVIAGAGIMGCVVLGALVANYVGISCKIEIPYGEDVFSLQTQLFDVLLPKMLPLLLTMGVMKLLDKGKKPMYIMVLMIIVGAVLSLLGII